MSDPLQEFDAVTGEGASTLVIACGALARETLAVVKAGGWTHLDVTCIAAELHNRPQLIPAAVERKILAARGKYRQIFAALADCGTGGALDRVLHRHGVTRIDGPHCYQFYATEPAFTALSDEAPGTLYLTDFLARHFDAVVWRGLGLDRFPHLLDSYFGNYTRVVYLAQTEDSDLDQRARIAADRLGLEYERVQTGMGDLAHFIRGAASASPASDSITSN
ncbi:MAG: DUF1638 domain-containing protein [Rhodospirillales bacterium]